MAKPDLTRTIITKVPKPLGERSEGPEIQTGQVDTAMSLEESEGELEENSEPLKGQGMTKRCHNGHHKNRSSSRSSRGNRNKGCPCNSYHHHGHRSSLKHLCICKICRDKIGDVFSHLQKPLLHIYINRKEFTLLCGYVTSNAGALNYTQDDSFQKHSTTKRPIRHGNNLDPYFDRHQVTSTRCKSILGIMMPSCLVLQLTFLLICLSVVTLQRLKLSVRTEKNTRVNKINSAAALNFILVLLSSIQIQTDFGMTRSQKSEKKYAKDVKYKIIDLLDVLKHNKKGHTKKILYDIINFCSPSRNESLNVYPVSRHFNEVMSAEMLRVGSLSKYPDENVPSLIRLAESGFYYDGNEKEVVCFSCGIKHHDWSYNAVPMEVHRRISPECPHLKGRFQVTQSPLSGGFSGQHDTVVSQEVQTPTNLRNIETDNVRTCSDSNEGSTPTLLVSSSPNPLAINSFDSGYGSSYGSSRSTLSRNSHQRSFLTSSSSGYSSGFISNQSSSGTGSREQQQQLPVLVEGREDNLISNVDTSVRDNQIHTDNRNNIPREKYPEYELKQRRIETYRNWPSNLTFLHPLDLSECGFFYSNFGDCVRCYHCGIGLRNWEADDNPWVEHARWSRKCPYILQKKGQQFIDSVLTALGLQTDSEIEQQTSNRNTVQSSQSTGYVTESGCSNDVRDPIQHQAAQYVIKEQIFGGKKERLVKKAMNQLLQNNDWDNITTDMLINTVIDRYSHELTDTDPNHDRSKGQSESKSPESAASANVSSKESGSVNNGDNKTSNNDEDPEKMQKENEELKDLYTCKICLDERVGITFVPCGHLVTCKNCSPQLRRCPLCRTFIRGTIKTTI